ncbi:hypothetical protein [Haloarcula montana]|uniref:hypothetical protein n=1 Tax=Haloarcula montana TaxID=3111776 RepID=UPI002D7A1688|nr:hypothetical protein [Haloarcula sp. GH36]
MDSESTGQDGPREPLPRDGFESTVLTVELEPSVGGGERAILYPREQSADGAATHWITAPSELLIATEAIR